MTNAAVTEAATPVPANLGDGAPQNSFAHVIEMLGEQRQPRQASSSLPGAASKDSKTGKSQQANATIAAGVLPTIVLALPLASAAPQAATVSLVPAQTVAAASASDSDAKTSSSPVVPSANAARAMQTNTPSSVAGLPATSSRAAMAELGSAKKSEAEVASAEVGKGQPANQPRNPTVPSPASAVDSSKDDSIPGPRASAFMPQQNIEEMSASTATAGVIGTAGAKQVAMMKSQGKAEGIARSGEKNLPQGNSFSSSGKTETTGAPPRSSGSTPSSEISSTAPSAWPVSPLGGASAEKTTPVVVEPRVESASAAQVTKVLSDVSDAAVSFKRVGLDSADVNLRPDKSTEISLHLSLNNGQVEVAARLERGNFDSLNTRWADLQQSLGSLGIRVGQLEHTTLNQNLGSNQQNNQTPSSQTASEGSGQGPGQRPSSRTAEDVEELPRVATTTTPKRAGSSSRPSSTGRGWEMWA
jgi:hypothetical protein